MPFYIYKSGANRTARPYVYTSGANRPVQRVYVYSGGANRLVFSALAASISPSSINTTGNPSPSATCNVSGNVGTVTYSWVRTSGDTRITVNAPSSAATNFSRTGFALNEIASATFTCTVTDTGTGLTTSASINVTMERAGSG
jgi:hypothetical protein